MPGWLVRKPEAVLFEAITNKHIPGGICFGMAFTSLLFHDFPAEDTRFPHTGGTDPWHMDAPAAPSEPLLRAVTENFSLQFTDQLIPAEVNAVLGIHGTNDDIDTIEAELAAGHPVMIGLIHFNGISIEGHTVLAYDSRPYPGGGTVVYLANSNKPFLSKEESEAELHNDRQFKNSEIVIKEGNWTFPEGEDFKGSGGVPWSGSEADMVVYHHSELPIINGERPHLPNLFTGTVMVAFGSSGDSVAQLSDGHGSLFSGGQLAPRSAWPKGVAPLADFNSAGAPLQLVSLNPALAGNVTATVARSAGGGSMDLRLPGLQASLQAGAHAGQTDRVTVDPHHDSLGYQSSAARTPLAGTLLSAPGAAAASAHPSATSDRIAQFRLTSGAGETLSFAQGRALSIVHAGPATGLSVTLSAYAADGLPLSVQLPPLQLAKGERLLITPASWRALGSAAIRVSSTVKGHRRTRLVHGRLLGARFATVRSAALLPLSAHHYTLALKLGLHHPPPAAALSVAFTVSSHGRVLERAGANRLTGAALRSGRVRLALGKPLPAGRYTLALRLLETTSSGAVQGARTVAKTLTVRAR